MSEKNLRIVVLGAPKAEKEFTQFVRDRKGAQRSARELAKELQKINGRARRALRAARKAREATGR